MDSILSLVLTVILGLIVLLFKRIDGLSSLMSELSKDVNEVKVSMATVIERVNNLAASRQMFRPNEGDE